MIRFGKVGSLRTLCPAHAHSKSAALTSYPPRSILSENSRTLVECYSDNFPGGSMRRSALAISALVITVATFAAPVRKSPSRPAVDSPEASPLAEHLMSLEKALPEAQKKHDRDFYNLTLTDDFIPIGTDVKVHPRSEIMGDFPSSQL